MTKDPISPSEANDIKWKAIPAYFEALNEELVKQYTGMTIYVYDADIISSIVKQLDMQYSTVRRILPYDMLSIVKLNYEKVGWEVTRPTEYKCNEDPHYIFKEV